MSDCVESGDFRESWTWSLPATTRDEIANFRDSRGLEVGQTSRSVQQVTGQEAGPTRQQPFSGEG